MKNHLFILSTLLVSFSAIAMDQQLFELVEKKDATREEVIDLLDRGASVHARASCDKTPLMVAATYSNQAVCEALIEGGAAVNATVQAWWLPDLSDNAWTPLYYAAESANHKVCALLLERGAELFGIYGLLVAPLDDKGPFDICIQGISPKYPNKNPYNKPTEEFAQTIKTLIEHAWALPDAHNQNETILPRSRTTIAKKIYITTLEKLRESVPQENLELLEQEHGDNLYKNIYQRVENPPTIHPESRTFSDSFTRKYRNVIFFGSACGILLFCHFFVSFSKPL